MAKMRLEWVRKLNGEIVTLDELQRAKEKSKTNHIEATYPGELVSEDTFYIGCLKGIGRIYHQIAFDCFSSFGAAKIYANKTCRYFLQLYGKSSYQEIYSGEDRKNPY